MNTWGWHFEWLYSAKMLITLGVVMALDVVLFVLGNRCRRQRVRGGR